MLNEQQSQPTPPPPEDEREPGMSEQIDVHRWRAEVQTFFAQVRQDLHYLSEACQASMAAPQYAAAPPQYAAPPQQYAAPPQQ